MSVTDLVPIDLYAIGISIVLLLAVIIYHILRFSNMNNCAVIQFHGRKLYWWRINLYTAVLSTWLISYFTFAVSMWFRLLLYPVFIYSTSYTLNASLPMYICKYMKQIGTCYCDFYEYNDLYPMIAVGSLGNLIFAFIEWNALSGLMVLSIFMIIAYLIAYRLPKKALKVHSIPDNLLIRTTDEYQEYVMMNPESNKLLVVVGNSCKFCDVQMEEINSLPDDFLQQNVRVLDVSDKAKVDKIILFSLNLDTEFNFKIPISFQIRNGMCVDQKEGFVNAEEIQFFVNQ